MKKLSYIVFAMIFLLSPVAFAQKQNNTDLFSVSPTVVNEGDHVILKWNIPNVDPSTRCNGTGGEFNFKNMLRFNYPGGQIIRAFKNTKYTLTCETPTGEIIQLSDQVKVKNANKHSTSFEFAKTDPIFYPKYGGLYYARMYWNVPNATCVDELVKPDGTKSPFPSVGTEISPDRTYGLIDIGQHDEGQQWTYNLTCTWPNGSTVTKTITY